MDDIDSRQYAKKKLSYLYIYLKRKNRSPIKQRGTLFNTKAETYITKSINNFNTSIYIPVSLPSLNIVGRQAKPFSFSKKTIIYTIDIRGETHTLNLNKIQYLFNCKVNTFGVKKLLGRGKIQIKNRNLVINKEGLSIFQFNKNIIIIEAPVKNRIVRSLKVRFNKGGLITKSLSKEDDTNISILIQAGNRGENTKNLN